MHQKLVDGVVELSNSHRWVLAKLEWGFENAYYSLVNQRCLCGHYPIRQICVIRNLSNKHITEVGNCCVNKFLGITEANKTFSSIGRLNKDLSKSMSKEALYYLRDKGVVSSYEFGFYRDTFRKRKLTEKQNALRHRINQKLLDYTNYERHSIFSKINLILRWAESNEFFDTSFVESIKRRCELTGQLSNKQKQALDNIIEKFGINKVAAT